MEVLTHYGSNKLIIFLQIEAAYWDGLFEKFLSEKF